MDGIDWQDGALTLHRVYQMAFTDGEWRIWRESPGLNQCFIGTLSEDGDTVEARWEHHRLIVPLHYFFLRVPRMAGS